MMDLTPFAAGIEGHSHIVLKVSCNEKAQISIITGITPYLRVLNLESLLTAEPSSAKDWIYPLKEVLFVSSELPNGITDIALVNIFSNGA